MAVASPPSARHLPGFSAPAVGFEQPFAMLEACHERVQRTLDLLGRLRLHVRAQGGADESARQAARDVLRYFDIAAPLHHEDEERHVFPLLMAGAPPEVRAVVLRLQQDHVHMAADWAAARGALQSMVDGSLQSFSDEQEALLTKFSQGYEAHIAAEETLIYPAAMNLVSDAEIVHMGQEMAARRRSPSSQA